MSSTVRVRSEQDSFGMIDVPQHCLWGAQTQRSLEHFAISTETLPKEFIRVLARVKRAAAIVNRNDGRLSSELANAIIQAADEVVVGQHDNEFPLSVWQTGSGTQTNMNMNEVLANRASELLGGERGMKRKLHPNDHCNLGQSSNDVFPTALHVVIALETKDKLLPSLHQLILAINQKATQYAPHWWSVERRCRSCPRADARDRSCRSNPTRTRWRCRRRSRRDPDTTPIHW